MTSLILSILISAAHAETSDYGLDELYSLAVKRSYSVELTVEQINQAEAQITQARSGFLPTLSAKGTLSVQETPSNALGESLFPSNQSTATVSLKQNLFNGFKDLASLRASDHQTAANKYAREVALIQVYKDLAQTYFNILMYREDARNYADQIASERRRRSDLENSRRGGRARESDIVASDSSVATLEAALASTKSLMVAHQEALTFLTGLPAEVKLRDRNSVSIKQNDLENWLSAVDDRPDVKKAKSEIEIAANTARATQSGYIPSIDLNANYYPYRPGVYEDVNWDATVSLSIPLYDGGLTKGRVREEQSVRRSKEISLTQVQEQAKQSIRGAYRTLLADQEQLERLKKAKVLSKRSYDLISGDNRRGIASNTDVLVALKSSQEAARAADRQNFKVLYEYALLSAEAGRIETRVQETK